MGSVEPVCPQQLLGYLFKLSCTPKLLAVISGFYADRYSTQGDCLQDRGRFLLFYLDCCF